MADTGCLLNFGSRQRDIDNVGSGQFDLIFDVLGSHVLDSVQQFNLSYTSFSQEVPNLHGVSRNGNVNGEVTVDESHLVCETTCHADDHVFNVRANGSDACKLLAAGKPQVDLHISLFDGLCAFLQFFHLGDSSAFHHNMFEVALQGAERPGNLDLSGIDFDLDCEKTRQMTGTTSTVS